jgi:hypothetical protein
MLCVFVAGDQSLWGGAWKERKESEGKKSLTCWDDGQTDGRNVLNWTWSSLQEEEGCWEGASAEIRRRRCPWRNKNLLSICWRMGIFFKKKCSTKVFVYYPKEWNFMFAQFFVYCGMDRIFFFLYFLYNVHTQKILIFLGLSIVTRIISKLKNRGVFWRTKQLKSLREIWFWCRWVNLIESRIETVAQSK